MTGRLVGTSVLLALVAGAVSGAAAIGAGGREGQAAQAKPIRFDPSELFIEINATDGDAGLQMNLGGDEWRRLVIRDPSGRVIMEASGEGRLRGYGLTDMFFESNEPPFSEVPFRRFRARFPEGRYTFRGTSVEGRRLIGSDRLTHDVPARPSVLAPAEDAVVDAGANMVVRWEPVTQPGGIRIVRYIVIVTEEGSERELSMDLGRAAASATIAPGFLAPGRDYAVEVLARERSGNQTITEVPFRTSR
jgi:Fibronectin type III domain